MRALLSQLNKVYVGTKSLSNECNPFFCTPYMELYSWTRPIPISEG